MIPGTKPKLEVHAKVRIGVKNERNLPTSVDYFVCEDEAFTAIAGDKPKALRIRLVHDTIDDAFSTGLEWWVKSSGAQRPTLACYTKGQEIGGQTVALRKGQMLDADDVVVDNVQVGQDRKRIVCRARECPHMQKKGKKPADCRPMGRLVFVLDGDPLSRVYELDTKAWNSIEALEGQLRLAQTRGSLAGRLFELGVRFEGKGTSRFPVLSIREEGQVPVVVNGDKGVSVAEATVLLANEYDFAQTLTDVERAKHLSSSLAAYLDVARPGWRAKQAFIDRIREVGVEAAIERILKDAE